jgi:hypothetical protein
MTARRLQTRCNSNRIGRTWRRSHVPRRLNALVSGNPCTDLQEGTREARQPTAHVLHLRRCRCWNAIIFRGGEDGELAMMPMLRVEMIEAGDGGRNGQRVDVGSVDELGLTGIPRATWHRAARGRESVSRARRDGRQRDCGVFGGAWAPWSVV